MQEQVQTEKTRYMQVYRRFRELIESGQLKKGARLPSVRRCAGELGLSRTTVETAYMQLAADGYVLARPQSGYYVTGMARREKKREESAAREERPARYDFSSRSVDRDSFDFDLWRRYVKSALRQDERLLSYGEPQGEEELRRALADYLAALRNIACAPEQIVIGAGTQSLLQILCPMLGGEKVVSFPTPAMVQGITVFESYGYEIHYKDKDAPVIYVSPSRMNRMGDVMPVSRRLELLSCREANGGLVIEDDYENEFQYPARPAPALFGLAAGRGVVYLGTFSRLLLPSIRISYMVLPPELLCAYRTVRDRYNQTASKTEQIALAQFIRDGRMAARLRKLRRLYQEKTDRLYRELRLVLGETEELCEHSLCVTLALREGTDQSLLLRRAEEEGIRFDGIVKGKDGKERLVLSSLTMPSELVKEAAYALKRICGWQG